MSGVKGQEGSAIGPGQDAHDQSIEAAIDQLEQIDESLPRSLAALHGAPDAVVAATIAAYHFGTRVLLNSLSLLEEGEDESGRLRISERGKQLMASSAHRYPEGDTDVDAALRVARNQLAHPEPAARLKVK